MALLQISEPGQSPNPHARRIAVGIDLGTTHSLVACVRNGVPECLPDSAGRVLLPSIVRYPLQAAPQVGYVAQEYLARDPENTIASVKRFMGRSLADIADAQRLPYHFVDHPGMLGIQTVVGEKSPVEVSAEILVSLRRLAEDTFNDDLYGAVITVPAYFDDAQRQATKDAARLAGLNVLRLINEPTAAAIAYGLDNASEGIYAVYDLGGGTFDVSILRLTQGVFEVVSTGGDSALGGDDYDHALMDWVLARTGLAISNAADKAQLKIAARACKEELSSAHSAIFRAQLTHARIEHEVQQTEFHTLSAALTKRTLDVVRRTLRDAKLSAQEIQGVVLVGGATRMPQVQSAIAQFFGCAPLGNLNPDEVVALGAALQADQLAGNNPANNLLLLDVIPLSLGIETMGGLVERIIPRNQTIPIAMAQDFTTYKDGQTSLALHVVQGERDLVVNCRSLARFELHGIPPMVAGAARIRVTFSVDADGLLHVCAREQTSGVEATIDVKPSYGLADAQIADMLQESFATAQADMHARSLVQARVDADRLVLVTQTALGVDGDLLDAHERAALQHSMQELVALCSTEDGPAIERQTKALALQTEAFAAMRMNRGIAQALAGKSIQSL